MEYEKSLQMFEQGIISSFCAHLMPGDSASIMVKGSNEGNYNIACDYNEELGAVIYVVTRDGKKIYMEGWDTDNNKRLFEKVF